MTTRTCRLSAGPALDLDIAETGPADGRPVILIHGLSDSWRSWRPLMAAMPQDLRLIAVSLRGHGDSGRTAAGYGLADMAGDLCAVMDRLGLARADVIGHSLGTMVAQKLAAIAPQRVASLVLIGAFVRMQTNPAVVAFWDESIAPLADPVDPGFVRAFQESAVGPQTPRAIIEDAVAESLKLAAADWKAALAAGLAEDLTPALDRYSGPVLVLHGQLDGFCRVQEQSDLIRGAGRRLISRPDWGHSPHWENPAEAARVLARFYATEAMAAAA